MILIKKYKTHSLIFIDNNIKKALVFKLRPFLIQSLILLSNNFNFSVIYYRK